MDGEELQLNIRFRELPNSVETGEAEMIGIDTIAKGSGTASASEILTQRKPEAKEKGIDKGTGKKESSQPELSQEEEEGMSLYKIFLITYNPLLPIWNILTLHSNRQPQHSPQRHPHPRIPHHPHQILPLQHLRYHRRNPVHNAITPNPPQHQFPSLPPHHPLSPRKQSLPRRSPLPKQRRPLSVAAGPARRKRESHAGARAQICHCTDYASWQYCAQESHSHAESL